MEHENLKQEIDGDLGCRVVKITTVGLKKGNKDVTDDFRTRWMGPKWK